MSPRRLYVDWSGDAGFKIRRGSSPFAVISIVGIESFEALDQRIAELRSDLRLPSDYEFHWAKNGWRERDAYIEKIRVESFQGWSLIVDKATLPPEYTAMQANDALYAWIAELTCRIPVTVSSGAELVIDDSTKQQATAKAIRVAVSSSLRARGIERRIAGARGLPAKRSAALQLADMIAGATRAWRVEKSRDYTLHPETKVKISYLREPCGDNSNK